MELNIVHKRKGCPGVGGGENMLEEFKHVQSCRRIEQKHVYVQAK